MSDTQKIMDAVAVEEWKLVIARLEGCVLACELRTVQDVCGDAIATISGQQQRIAKLEALLREAPSVSIRSVYGGQDIEPFVSDYEYCEWHNRVQEALKDSTDERSTT